MEKQKEAALSVNVHPRHIGFPVALDHTQKFPAIALIKARMVSYQIGGRDAFSTKILDCHIQKLSGNASAAVALLGINSADVGCQVGSVMEVVFDYTQSANDFVAIKTEEPTQLGFLL